MLATSTIKAYAKINLILQVEPPITDPSDPMQGFHPLCSWMHSIDLFDEISISSHKASPHPADHSSTTTFDIRWDDGSTVDWPTESDLIFKAHSLLQRTTSRSLPCSIQARKSIPAGGGLGGGSSNAASVLMGLNQLFELGFNESQLQSIAHRLGTDIPYFIDLESFAAQHAARPAIVTGVGDQITRTPRHKSHITLLLPGFGCSTAEVYKQLDAIGSSREINPDELSRIASLPMINPDDLTNDLKLPAINAQPALGEIFSNLFNTGLHPKLSGSGSTIFLLGDVNEQAKEAIQSSHPEISVLSTSLV